MVYSSGLELTRNVWFYFNTLRLVSVYKILHCSAYNCEVWQNWATLKDLGNKFSQNSCQNMLANFLGHF